MMTLERECAEIDKFKRDLKSSSEIARGFSSYITARSPGGLRTVHAQVLCQNARIKSLKTMVVANRLQAASGVPVGDPEDN
ncbi:hypothetical protein [Mesorhizobium prunaredense]|uniref:hypothetical protein n=1 Tax=Mesorhizobium prunaredense TaxID=1631249 RepID=UPI00117EF25E|nr:hypothetical protein [Mesorhizobium prunaredense]